MTAFELTHICERFQANEMPCNIMLYSYSCLLYTQAVVASILRCFSLEKLCEVDGIADIVEGLLPYSERHYQRLDRYLLIH
jgi:Utp13 specific WD40 associated domain